MKVAPPVEYVPAAQTGRAAAAAAAGQYLPAGQGEQIGCDAAEKVPAVHAFAVPELEPAGQK